MSQSRAQSLGIVGPALTALTAASLFLYVIFSGSFALANPFVVTVQDQISQDATPSIQENSPGLRGTMLGFPRPRLGESDRIAALKAFQIALTQVGDGTNYVWYRSSGRLSGIIRPVRSFADARGRICRELKVTMHAGRYHSRTMDGTACRADNGRWMLGR